MIRGEPVINLDPKELFGRVGGLCSVDSVQIPYGMEDLHGGLLRKFISWGQDRLIAELTQQLHAAHDYILQQMGLKDLGFASCGFGPNHRNDDQERSS